MDSTPKTTLDNVLSFHRTEVKKVGEGLNSLRKGVQSMMFQEGVDKEEIIANITLAYRHMEDTAMRLGKAIQAYEGGKSIYDQNDAKRVADLGPVGENGFKSI